MQQQRTKLTNTAPRPGQFEDADHDVDPPVIVPPVVQASPPLASSSTKVPKASLQRRLSSHTTEATKALLEFAASANNTKTKKKTFVVRLEEIKKYCLRHGRPVPLRDPVAEQDEPWEQNLIAWVQDCRKQLAEGGLSPEKAQALHEAGCEGFRTNTIEQRPPQAALQEALFRRQQEEEARMIQLLALRRAQRQDPDGVIPPGAFPSASVMAREALVREQMMIRERYLAQAMAARRLSSMGAYASPLISTQVLPLLQPLDSVPPRADYSDPRINPFWLLQQQQQQQQQQRRASLQESLLRRASDASGAPAEIHSGVRTTLEECVQTVVGATDPTITPPTQPKKIATASPTTTPTEGKSKRALPKSWHQSFTELQAFKEKFGHCDVKMIVNSPYSLLGKWLASQRSRHKLGQLPIDKVNRLREIGCQGFDKGTGRVPIRSQYRADDEEAEFDQAIRSQRCKETAEDEPQDEACSPATREKRIRHSYEARIEHIKAFQKKHGHVKIRLGSADKHEELLARWLASARSRYRGGQFKEERAAELRALGCDGFDGTANTSDDMEEVVEEESRKRGSPARTATPSPTPLQEEPPAKKQRGLGRRQTFDDMLKELEEYQYVYGVGCSVPKPDGDAGKLGRWLAFQRRQFIAGKLSDDRIQKLKDVGRKEFSQSALIVRAAERAAAGIHIDQ